MSLKYGCYTFCSTDLGDMSTKLTRLRYAAAGKYEEINRLICINIKLISIIMPCMSAQLSILF